MRIKITRSTLVAGNHVEEGTVISDIDEKTGKFLMQIGKAVEAPEENTPAGTRSRGARRVVEQAEAEEGE